MKSNDFLNENIVSDAQEMHLDHEVQMARQECYHAAEDAITLHKLLRHMGEQQGLEGWVSAKITLAADYLNTVREHLEYQLMSGASEEPVEVVAIAENVITAEDLGPVDEGEVYDLEKEYGYEKPKAQPKRASVPPTRPSLHPEDTDFMDPVERRLRADRERVKAAWAAHNAKKGVSEGLGLYGPFTATINTGERPQSRTKTKKFRREDDAILWAQDWLEDAPQYVFATAEVTDPEGNVVWTTDEQGVAEGVANGYYYLQGGIEQSNKFASAEEAEKQVVAFGNEARVPKVTLRFKAPGAPSKTVKTFSINNEQGVAEDAGSIATVVNPTPKNKAKVGTLFGGTYKQKKAAK